MGFESPWGRQINLAAKIIWRNCESRLVVRNGRIEDSSDPDHFGNARALATEIENLYGTWRLVSDVRKDVETGAMTDNFGRHPQGFLTYGRDGRMSAIEVAEQRPEPADLSKVTDLDRAALFRTMLAYAGTFSFDGEVVTHHVDISWNNNWTGTNQIRNARLEGRRLYITTNVQPSTIDGRLSIGILTWERVE